MSPLPPGYAIASVLQFVALNLHQHWPLSFRERVARAEAIVNLMEEIIIHCPKDHTRPSQLTLGIFAQTLPSDQCKILYDLLNKGGIALKEDAALHFAETLSQEMESKHIALDILLDLANKGTDLNKPKVASVVTTLLHCHRHASVDSEVPETSASFSKQALEALMEYDFVPNFINLTAFLDSLCWDGELDEAIRLALLFTESGARLDGRTFANIFRAAKASRDPELMRRALDVAKVANAPIVGVFNNALHAVFYVNEMESRDAVMAQQEGPQVFLAMLRLYSQRFTLEPLQTLFPESLALILANNPAPEAEEPEKKTTLAVAQAFFKDADIPKREPDATTLAIMLRAYVRSLHYPQDIVYFYEYFKSTLESNGDGEVNFARQVVEKHRSLIHDTVLLSMLQHSIPTRESLRILGDMLRDNLSSQAAGSTGSLESSDAQEEHKPVHPAPTIFTLSIMISRLLRRKETMVAEQLMDVMKEHGIEPNLAHWNSLVKGYALMQDVPQTVRTLQQLEATGHKPDDRTYKAFNSLQDQGRALELMDQIIRDNTARLAEDHSP
ncbi:PPR repeat family protein [Sarocladium implicatum]|nr:PPR repeat family protein [Sarocladium implicatum]